MQINAEHRRSSKSQPRPFASNDEVRAERRTSRAAPYAPPISEHAKERFGPTYGCVEWFMYEEAIPAPQQSCD